MGVPGDESPSLRPHCAARETKRPRFVLIEKGYGYDKTAACRKRTSRVVALWYGAFQTRTKRVVSSPGQRNPLSFCNEDETGSFRLPGNCAILLLQRERNGVASSPGQSR